MRRFQNHLTTEKWRILIAAKKDEIELLKQRHEHEKEILKDQMEREKAKIIKELEMKMQMAMAEKEQSQLEEKKKLEFYQQLHEAHVCKETIDVHVNYDIAYFQPAVVSEDVKKKVVLRSGRKNKKICDLCGSILKNRKTVMVHMNSVHLRNKVSSCTLCSKEYKKLQSLQYHQSSTHHKVKGYECRKFTKRFTTGQSL